MQKRHLLLGMLVVGLLWHVALVAQTVTRDAGGGATAPPVSIVLTQTASDTFVFQGSATPSAGASIVSFTWNFGDGTTAIGPNVSHRYSVAGLYKVILTVVDSRQITTSAGTVALATTGDNNSNATGSTLLGIDLVTRGTRFEFYARSTASFNGTLDLCSWKFGDGATGSGAMTAHYYTAAGTFIVVLTCPDSKGVLATSTKTITVSLGTSAVTAPPTDQIASSAKSSDTFDFSVVHTNMRTSTTVASYAWNFGDGSTASGATVSHRYATSGTYTVTLSEDAGAGAASVATQTVTVTNNSSPTASIIATATAPDTYTFSSTASAAAGATIVAYSWDFGDGGTSSGSTASHRYSASGTYTVVLTVSDSKGASGTATKSVVATAGASPPSVTIGAAQTAMDTYNFTAIATAFAGATIASYAWNFGDGSTGSGAATSHRYSASGTFNVAVTVVDSNGVSGSATQSVTATVSGPPGPPISSGRVRPGYGDTNWLNASTALLAPWVNGGGDWFDKNGVFNGPTPTILVPIPTNAPISVDISGIDGDLLLTGIYGWGNPLIDGQPAIGFGMNSSSDQSQPLPTHWNDPGIILNPARGRVLTLTPVANPLGQTLRIDKVAGPTVNDYPNYVGPSNTPDVWSLEMIDEATIRARTAGGGRIDDPFAYEPQFGVEANGLKYLRTAITPSNQRDISWRLPYPPTTAVHTRFCIYLEDDIADGMTELGVKLMAGASNEVVGPTQPLIVYRINHGHQSPNNRGVYALYDYLYDAESGPSFPEGHSINAMVRAGQWSCIEQAVRLNSGKGVHDGYGELWINGHSVWSTNTAYYRDDGTTTLTNFFANLYHGGLGYPSADIHYRIAKLAVSSTYIGVPQELLGVSPPSPPSHPSGSLPAWRRALTQKDVWGVATTNTFHNAPGNVGGAEDPQINIWNGAAAHGGNVYFGLGGGHNVGEINSMWVLNLNQDVPSWTKLNPGSDPRDQRDGWPYDLATYTGVELPATRHTYFTPQWFSTPDGHGRAAFFLNGGNTYPTDGSGGKGFIDAFDPVTNRWDPRGTWSGVTLLPNDIAWGSPTCMDPRTEDVWIYASGYTGNMWKWTKATNSWQNYGPQAGMPQSWWYKPSLIDGTRDRYIVLAVSGNQFGVIDGISNPARMVARAQTVVPPAGASWTGDYGMLVHDTINDRYLLAMQWSDVNGPRQSVFAINPTTWVATYVNELPYPILNLANGIMGRFAFHPTLDGLSWTPHSASPTYFMPLR